MRVRPGALAELKIGENTFPIVPLWSVSYLALVLGILAVAVFYLDRIWLPRMVDERLVASAEWSAENERLYREMAARIGTLEDPVWQSDGFRVARESSGPRILVMCDSYCWGAGLANINDIWWRQLDIELARRGYRDVEVISAARNGASTRDQLAMARVAVEEYSPDLVIWGYVTNDADEGAIQPLTPSESRALHEPSLVDVVIDAISVVAPAIGYQLRSRRDLRVNRELSSPENGYEYRLWELELAQPENLDRYEKTLQAVARFQEEVELPYFFVTLPSHPDRSYYEARYKEVLERFRANGIEVIDLLPGMIEHFENEEIRETQYLANPVDRHPGPAVTSYYASAVADQLEARFPDLLDSGRANPLSEIAINDWVPASLDVRRESRNEWSFAIPPSMEEWLRMPGDRPYMQFNLSESAHLSSVRVISESLRQPWLAVTVIGPNGFDDLKPHPLEDRARRYGELETHSLPAAPVSTIRVYGSLKEREELRRRRLTGPYQPVGKFGWRVPLPDLSYLSGERNDSPLELWEDEVRLGPPNRTHQIIFTSGGGSFSHWKEWLYFSTSDRSDPNTNGRSYSISYPAPPSRALIEIVPAR